MNTRVNWFAFERGLRSHFAQVVPDQRLHGLGEQYFETLIAQALQTAKNLHRGSPTGAVGSQLFWAESMDDLRRQMAEHRFVELFPEEEELCQLAFARPFNKNRSLVLVWRYAPDDLEFEFSSEWFRRASTSGGGGGGHGYSSGSGGGSSGGWH